MMREMMRRLFELLVNNIREHFMIYLALWLRWRLSILSGYGFSEGSGSGIPSFVFNRPRDLLKILLPFSRPARSFRCSSSGSLCSSMQASLQQPANFSAQAGH